MLEKSSISLWAARAAGQLKSAGIPSYRLDAELILTHTLRKSRTFLHAHGDKEIESRYLDILDTRLALRCERVPIAYIVGHKEFYGRNFTVSPSVLIPRPESETMITLLKKHIGSTVPLALNMPARRIVDVGTGSGCLGITAKLELPELDVTLCDTSRYALTVAEANAKRLRAAVTLLRSNLLQGYHLEADFILANLPYVDPEWEVSAETRHEPAEALFTTDGGLQLINRLLEEVPEHLRSGGLVFIEADPRQHYLVTKHAKECGFTLVEKDGFILTYRK